MSSKTRARHGVLVTYRRPEQLAEHLECLAHQSLPLSTLTIVDNDGDPQIEALANSALGQNSSLQGTRYLNAQGNPGPAGGFHRGIAAVLSTPLDDDDLLVLLDDNDPPRTTTVFADSYAAFEQLVVRDRHVGAVGSWGARLSGRGRLRMVTSTNPDRVDYLAGGGCPHYLARALRDVGGPDPELFFGFEELDLGRSLSRQGWSLWSSGLAREHGWAEKMVCSRAAAAVSEPSWRRYYSIRNLVTVLRRDGRVADAVFVSVVAGLAKPLVNLPIRPRMALQNLTLTVPAVLDAWSGRLGRRVEPVG